MPPNTNGDSVMTHTEKLINNLLSRFEFGSKEHSDLLLRIQAAENRLYRELQVIEEETA